MAINNRREAQEKLTILELGSLNSDTISYRKVKIAYKRLSSLWHPDKYDRDSASHPANSKEEAENKSAEINDAHADLEEFIRAREAGYTCPHCFKEASANVVRNGTFCCHCFRCGEKKSILIWLNVNGQILFVCFDPPNNCCEKIKSLPNCHKCNKKCYPSPIARDIFTGFDFCSDDCKNNSGLGPTPPTPPTPPLPNTLNQAKISAKNTIQTLLHNKQVKSSDLDSNLWNNATNWEIHLEALLNISEITQFTTKMEQAINSFHLLSPNNNKNSLSTWIIGGLIAGLFITVILLFRKKYVLKKQTRS